MVKVEVAEEETKAYIELLKDAKLPADMGYILTTLKIKMIQSFQKDQKDQQDKYVKQLVDEKEAKKASKKRLVSNELKK